MAYGGNNFISAISSQNAAGEIPASGYILGRVAHVVYGPYLTNTDIPDPDYNDPTDLGKIRFLILNNSQSDTSNNLGNQPAMPFYSWMKQYPVQGEYVYIVQGPSLFLNENTEQKTYFYLPPFSLWGSNHHNALPNLNDYGAYVNELKRYYGESLSTNQANNVTTGSIQYPLGNDFYEKGNVKTLKMFVGDVAFEGRYGASIRFGSSLATNKDKNYWWNGPNGNPITILRNGQGKQIDQEGWIPTVENINTDPSSIYLTNGQVVVIDDLNNFPLNSFNISIEQAPTEAIPLNQQLTSIDAIAASEQDRRINNQNPNVVG
jgi:hypothetical protein